MELVRSIPGTEVVAPAAQYRVDVLDQHSDILDPAPIPTGQLLHPLPDPLQAPGRRPALEEVDTFALRLPDPTRQSLAQMAIAWVLRDPRVSSALIGASSPAQLEDSVGALEGAPFSDEELTEIDRYAVPGSGVDLWNVSAGL